MPLHLTTDTQVRLSSTSPGVSCSGTWAVLKECTGWVDRVNGGVGGQRCDFSVVTKERRYRSEEQSIAKEKSSFEELQQNFSRYSREKKSVIPWERKLKEVCTLLKSNTINPQLSTHSLPYLKQKLYRNWECTITTMTILAVPKSCALNTLSRIITLYRPACLPNASLSEAGKSAMPLG